MAMHYTEQDQGGTGRFAFEEEIHQNFKWTPQSLQIGHVGQSPLYCDAPTSGVVIGGAGSNKFTALLSYMTNLGGHSFWFDPKGEMSMLSLHNSVRLGKPYYAINPDKIGVAEGRIPFMRVNITDHLKRGSPSLMADCISTAKTIVVRSTSGKDDEYFADRCEHWIAALLYWHVQTFGTVTLIQLYDMIAKIMNGQKAWAEIAALMQVCGIDFITMAANEIWDKQEAQKTGGNEFGAISGTLMNHVQAFGDTNVRDLLSDENGPFDFSLDVLLDENVFANVAMIIPAAKLDAWRVIARICIGRIIDKKLENFRSPRITMLIDECAVLKGLGQVLRAFEYGRGAQIRCIAFYQSISQIEASFNKSGMQSMMNSAGLRIMMGGGVRDPETSQYFERLLGNFTMPVYEANSAYHATEQRKEAIRKLVFQNDLNAVYEARRLKEALKYPQYHQRPVLTANEILVRPDLAGKMIIWRESGYPILGDKVNYYENPAMAGQYLSNLYVPDACLDHVDIMGRRGKERRRIIRETVPDSVAWMPQYKDGTWQYVEGFRPRV